MATLCAHVQVIPLQKPFRKNKTFKNCLFLGAVNKMLNIRPRLFDLPEIDKSIMLYLGYNHLVSS